VNLFLKSKMKGNEGYGSEARSEAGSATDCTAVAAEDKPMTWQELQAMEEAELKAAS